MELDWKRCFEELDPDGPSCKKRLLGAAHGHVPSGRATSGAVWWSAPSAHAGQAD